MAHFQNKRGAVQQAHRYDVPNSQVEDEYGNPVVQTDEYGNPVHHTGTTGVSGTRGFDSTTATGMRGHGTAPAAGTGLGGGHHGLHRSGSSSSSSSSEDDGQGGRRKKKGLKEKIKEKLQGVGHRDERSQASATTTPGGYKITGEGQYHHHQHHQQHEKKGIMEKVKEKLPGHHH